MSKKKQAANPEVAKKSRANLLARTFIKAEKNYEIDDRFHEASTVEEAHTMAELAQFVSKGECDIEVRALCVNKEGKTKLKRLGKESFLEAMKGGANARAAIKRLKMREAGDAFLTDQDFSGANAGLVGDDYVPLLGGPFNKQQYFYDYLRGHAASFHAHNHDPFARRIISLIRQFVLGKGFKVQIIEDDPKKKQLVKAIYEAFAERCDIETLAEYALTEISIYGEVMVWKLPNKQTKIGYQLAPSQQVPTGEFPRFRLIDPSAIWEVITYPEDITRVLAYQWVAPTQYQIYTAQDGGKTVPSLKFIVQQIPADQVMHFKTNTVSSEKRGRGDLYPILGYLKRLRDSVNYSIIGLQKQAAWAIDTTIEGSDADIDAYVSSQQATATIAPAGSEFVHTASVKREYLSNTGTSQGQSEAFDWCLSMIAAGAGIPISYFGTHQSGGQTRASAFVGTEPVAKFMEERQTLLGKILRRIILSMFKDFGIDSDVEIIFPEIITQDRSAKIKDISTAEQLGYISKERAATMVAKELGVEEYDYKAEMKTAQADPTDDASAQVSPLTSPGAMGSGRPTGNDKAQVSKSGGF